jgi:hypothetical protein
MMVPKKSLLLAGAALALFGAASNAQSQSGKIFTRVNKPLKSATLDLATGTITRGPAVHNRAAATVVDFFNTDLGGFVGVDTGNGFCEWFDAGVKGSLVGDGTALVDSGNCSDLMNSIVFAYCSAKLTPGSGGPGGSVKLGFYEGYVTGGGTATTGVAVFTLTGLPGNSASSSFFGGFGCFFIRVFFGNLICFADGPIGYSWKFIDNGTGTLNPQGAILGATFPFLSCVRTCSAAIDQIDGQGMEDRIDEYCPPGTLRTTFTFGTTSGSFTSINMDVEEVVDVVGTSIFKNSTTFPNPDILTSDPAVVGVPWNAYLKLGRARTKGSLTWSVFFGASKVNPPTGVPIAQIQGGLNFGASKNGRMLLCAIDPGFACNGVHTGVSGSVSSTNCGGAPIPKVLNLVCNEWCAQAVVFGAGIPGEQGNARLSSVVNGAVGTPVCPGGP